MVYRTVCTLGNGFSRMSAIVITVLQSSDRSSHMLCGAASRLLLIGSSSWSPST